MAARRARAEEAGTVAEAELPRFLTPRDIAEHLKLDESTVRRLLIDGELCPYVRFGRSIRVDPAKLQEWIEEREQRFSVNRGVIRKR